MVTKPENPAAESTAHPGFQLGAWLVVPDRGELRRRGETVRIEPKAMEVLVYLAGRQGEVVTRERTWNGKSGAAPWLATTR